MFMLYFLYGVSLFGMGMILVSIFDSIRTSFIGGLVISLGSYYLRYVFQNSTPMIWRIIGGIIPSLNMYNANHVLWIVQSHKEVSLENMSYVSKNYSLNIFLVMCLFDFFFWLLLGLYITYIVPTEFGTRRHPCFCLMFKGRRGKRNRNRDSPSVQSEYQTLFNNEELEFSGIEEKEAEGKYERVGNDLRNLEDQQQCLQIRDLMKVYSNGFKAVDGLNLNMYSGQIFALLGHNGAGKTTTISVLTGLFEATAGQAHAFGIDLLNDQDEARKIMGVCPQHNVLFPTLTPTEHFDIFCDFKGVPNSERKASIQK